MFGLTEENINNSTFAVPHFQLNGRLESANGVLSARIPAAVDELCVLKSKSRSESLAKVIGFENGLVRLLPFHPCADLTTETRVCPLRRRLSVPCGPSLLGRILNGVGDPIDRKGPVGNCEFRNATQLNVPDPLQRTRIDTPLFTGQRVIDGFLSLGLGQRVGLFAGSGVGKSTLLGEIAKQARVDCNVILLIGERGREVLPFLEDCLGPTGLERSVVVIATSDETPMMRVQAVQTGVIIADYFRSQGQQVMLMIDSLTRLAMAQREIGLLLGEPPTSRGYTPSVFQLLANTLEMLGNSDAGGITAITTVLVDADDMDDPIADSVRSIVDGHIVLSRHLAELGHYPAVDLGASVSRVFDDVTSEEHRHCSRKIRRILAIYNDNIDLIKTGAYEPGSSLEMDDAIRLIPSVNGLLQQSTDEFISQEELQKTMKALASQWRH